MSKPTAAAHPTQKLQGNKKPVVSMEGRFVRNARRGLKRRIPKGNRFDHQEPFDSYELWLRSSSTKGLIPLPPGGPKKPYKCMIHQCRRSFAGVNQWKDHANSKHRECLALQILNKKPLEELYYAPDSAGIAVPEAASRISNHTHNGPHGLARPDEAPDIRVDPLKLEVSPKMLFNCMIDQHGKSTENSESKQQYAEGEHSEPPVSEGDQCMVDPCGEFSSSPVLKSEHAKEAHQKLSSAMEAGQQHNFNDDGGYYSYHTPAITPGGTVTSRHAFDDHGREETVACDEASSGYLVGLFSREGNIQQMKYDEAAESHSGSGYGKAHERRDTVTEDTAMGEPEGMVKNEQIGNETTN